MEGIPPIAKIPVASFVVRHAVSAVPGEDHVVHVEGILPSDWQMTPCERVGRKEDDRN